MPGHLRPIKVNSGYYVGYIEKYLCQKLGHKTFELNAVTYKLTDSLASRANLEAIVVFIFQPGSI